MIPNFRAWLKEEKEMIDVDEIHWSDGQLDFIGDGITFKCKSDDLVLMQSTGLKDKNGKEIFEGDIVQFLDCYIETDFLCNNSGIVKWSQGGFTITDRFSVTMEDLLDGDSLDVKIIGNIYEKPELL